MGRGTRPALVQGQSDHKMVPDSPEKKVSQKMVAPLLGLGTQNAGGLTWPDSSLTPLWVHTVDISPGKWWVI